MRMALAVALVFSFTLSLFGQPRPEPKPAPANPYPLQLYQMNDVTKSLNLNDKQVGQLRDLDTTIQGRMRDDYGKLGDIPEKDRFSRTQDLNRTYMNDWNKGARDIFNEDQAKRYGQLQLQYGGFGSLSDPDIQKRLNLTEEQQKDLRGQIDWSVQQQGQYNSPDLDADKRTKLYEDYRKAYQERWNKYLTPEQQKSWKSMSGDPYEFKLSVPPPKR